MSVNFINIPGFPGMNNTPISDERKEQLKQIVQASCGDPNVLRNTELTSKEYKYICDEFVEIITHPVFVEREGSTDILERLCSAYRHAKYPNDVWKALVPNLLASADKFFSLQGRVYVYDLLAVGTSSPDQFNIWPFFTSKLDTESSDKMRACILFLLNRCFNYHYGNEEKMKNVKELCQQIIEQKKYGPLTRISAAILLLVRGRDDVFIPAIPVLIDAVIQDRQYSALWNEEEFEADWIIHYRGGWYKPEYFDEAGNEPFMWVDILPDVLQNLDGNIIATHVRPPLVEALKNNLGNTKCIVATLIMLTFDEKLYPNTYFAELEPTQQKLIKELAQLPQTQTTEIQNLLERGFNIPKDLNTFISTPLPNELLDTKRVACLEGLSKVKWSELNHAYGHASNLPDLVKALASRSPERREGAWGGMWSGPYHQGTRYSGTVALIGFIIQLLECNRVEEKEKLMKWLESVACTWPESYTIIAFDPKRYNSQEDHYNEDQTIRRQCFDEVEKGCPNYLNLALDYLVEENLPVVWAAISILSRYPSFKPTSLPKLQEMYAKPDSLVRGSAILAISHLTHGDPTEVEKLKQTLSQKLSQVTDYASLSANDFSLLLMEALALGRLYVPNNTSELPICVKSVILHALENSVNGDSAFGKLPNIVKDFLSFAGSQFRDDMLDKLANNAAQYSSASLIMLIKSLLATSFEEQSGSCFSYSAPPEFFKLKIDNTQARVLQALVDCDALWQLPESSLKSLMSNLHTLLQINHDPTRQTLRRSLEKFRENQENTEVTPHNDVNS